MADIWDEFQVYNEDPIQFFSAKQVIQWLENEKEAWDWLWNGDQGEGSVAPNAFSGFGNRLQQMINGLNSDPQSNQQQYIAAKQSTYAGAKGNMIVSSSRIGQDILAIKDRIGEPEARFVFNAHYSQLDLNGVKSPTDMRGALLFATPQYIDPTSFAEELKIERKRYRSEVTQLQSRVRELEQDKRDREARRANQMRRIAHRFRTIIEAKSTQMVSKLGADANEINSKLIETEDRFRKQMELQAPVEYWNEKSKSHGRWEIGFSLLSGAYFIVAAFALYGAASGALLGITTLIFWIGRLVIKLWLSEHHLRIDSNERAVMTKTYLAMTENDSASNEDRAIVLSAIFRPTPDGVVKEEGPNDFGVNAQLARLITR